MEELKVKVQMALAQHINIQNTQKVDDRFLRKILKLSTAVLKRLWWHTQAYTTVFGMMLLTVASLAFIYIHWSGKKSILVVKHEVIKQK